MRVGGSRRDRPSCRARSSARGSPEVVANAPHAGSRCSKRSPTLRRCSAARWIGSSSVGTTSSPSASRWPVASSRRSRVSSDGRRSPRSMRLTACWLVPARSASWAWLMPCLLRASRTSIAASITLATIPPAVWMTRYLAPSAELWFTSSPDAISPDRAHRGPPRADPRADRARGPRPDRARRLPRGAGRRGRGRGRGGDRQRVPPLPVQGRAVRRGLPARLPARGRRHARRGRGGRGRGAPAARRRRRDLRATRPARAPAGLGAAGRARRPGRRGRAPGLPPRLRHRLRPGPARRRRGRRAGAPERRAHRRRPRRRAGRGAGRPAVLGGWANDDVDADALVSDLVTFCLRSVTEETH